MIVKQSSRTGSEKKNFLRAFTFHGVQFHREGGTGHQVADCPFCGKEDHFHANAQTGQWDCKRCGESGNLYTFLAKVWAAAVKPNPKAVNHPLATRRSLPFEAFVLPRYWPLNDTWIWPVYNIEGKLAGLRAVLAPDSKSPPMQTAETSLHLISPALLPLPELLAKHPDAPVYLCEGDWDAFALQALTSRSGFAITAGVPGANTFKPEWAAQFVGRDITLLYDNDDPGRAGMEKAARILSEARPSSLKVIAWPNKKPYSKDGFDVNDFVSLKYKQHGKKLGYAGIARDCLNELLSFTQTKDDAMKKTAPKDSAKESKEPKELKEPKESKASKVTESSTPAPEPAPQVNPDRKPGKALPFQKLLNEYRKVYHVTKTMDEAIAIMLASAFSIRIPYLPDAPVWIFMVSPSGGGKTIFLRSMELANLCKYESSLRATSLISGMELEDKSDPSLLPKLLGHCLVLKDFTEILDMPTQEQDDVFKVLRGAYDGVVTRTYGNGERRDYKGHMSLVSGVTGEIHAHSRTSVGERFLKYTLLGSVHDREKHIHEVIHRSFSKEFLDKEIRLRNMVADFLDRPLPKSIPKPPAWLMQQVVPLAQLSAYLRASVNRSWRGDLAYRPEAEVGTRLAKQFLKLSISLAVTLGKKTIDRSVYAIVERVALATAYGFNLDIIRALAQAHPKPLSKLEIVEHVGITESTLGRRLDDLMSLGLITRDRLKEKAAPASKKAGGGQFAKLAHAGQPPFGYTLHEIPATLWKKAKIR